MRHILTFIFLLSTLLGFSQKEIVKYPKGVYYTHQDLMNKKPNKEYKLTVDRRPSASIKRYGGNDFILRSPDSDIKEKEIKKRFYAFSTGDKLYLNGLKHKLQPWYFEVISDGKFFVFKSTIATNIPKNKRETQIANAVGEKTKLSGPSLATLRFIYIMNKDTQEIKVVDKQTLPEILVSEPGLVSRFENELDKTNSDILLKYIIEFNKIQ